MALELLHQSSGPTFELSTRESELQRDGGAVSTEGDSRGGSKWDPMWESPCQWAHLTAALMDRDDVPPGSRWDSVVSSVTAGEGWSALLHKWGSADHTMTWLLHWCGSSSISMSVLQGYWNKNPCIYAATGSCVFSMNMISPSADWSFCLTRFNKISCG